MKMTIIATPTGPMHRTRNYSQIHHKKMPQKSSDRTAESSPDLGIPSFSSSFPRRRILHGSQANHLLVCLGRNRFCGMCKNIFLPALNRLDGVATPEWVDAEEKYPAAEERDYKRLLLYALREGKKMISSRDYEFVRVFEVTLLDWLAVTMITGCASSRTHVNGFRMIQKI